MHRYLRIFVVLFALLVWMTAMAPVSARLPRAEMVFARFDGPKKGIKLLRPSSGKVRSLTQGAHQFPSWSSDRTQIAFIKTKQGAPHSLWVIARSGGAAVKLVTFEGGNPYRIGFDWAPGGTHIVYSDRLSPGDSYNLYTVELATTEVTQVTDDETTDEEAPTWSPTGELIAYQSSPRSDSTPRDDYDIYTVAPDSGDVEQLTTHERADYEPVWSPDGTQIAFFSTRDDDHGDEGPYLWELYSVMSDGTNERRLTEQSTRKTGASWSPDGRWIAYRSRCDDDLCGNDYKDNIWIVDADTTEMKRITKKSRRGEASPAWSPNSRWISYALLLKGGRTTDLAMTRVSDRKEVVLTQTKRAEGRPDWASR